MKMKNLRDKHENYLLEIQKSVASNLLESINTFHPLSNMQYLIMTSSLQKGCQYIKVESVQL